MNLLNNNTKFSKISNVQIANVIEKISLLSTFKSYGKVIQARLLLRIGNSKIYRHH